MRYISPSKFLQWMLSNINNCKMNNSQILRWPFWKMAEINSESQFFFPGNIANMLKRFQDTEFDVWL